MRSLECPEGLRKANCHGILTDSGDMRRKEPLNRRALVYLSDFSASCQPLDSKSVKERNDSSKKRVGLEYRLVILLNGFATRA
jgi:hypothetical protein